MSIMNKILSFTRTPQGRRMTEKATRYASSPEGKRRIAEARQRVTSKRRISR
jgi:hypothetical protein